LAIHSTEFDRKQKLFIGQIRIFVSFIETYHRVCRVAALQRPFNRKIRMFRRNLVSAAAFSAALSLASLASAAAGPLQLDVYNPGAKSMFPVSSELVTGDADAVLIDAQFQRNDAEALVQKIKASGKKLTTVYISHSDPDYYFGLDVIQAAFPEAKIVATPQTWPPSRPPRTGSSRTGVPS
jgi:hypothetical protein